MNIDKLKEAQGLRKKVTSTYRVCAIDTNRVHLPYDVFTSIIDVEDVSFEELYWGDNPAILGEYHATIDGVLFFCLVPRTTTLDEAATIDIIKDCVEAARLQAEVVEENEDIINIGDTDVLLRKGKFFELFADKLAEAEYTEDNKRVRLKYEGIEFVSFL